MYFPIKFPVADFIVVLAKAFNLNIMSFFVSPGKPLNDVEL